MENNKRKKLSLLFIILGFLILIIALIIFLWPKPKEVTITFDSKGGVPIAPFVTTEGSVITLPDTYKKGYTFVAWYWEGIKMEGKTIRVKEDRHLIAKWVINPKTDPAKPIMFDITFDSKGGSEVEKITIECGKGIELPKSPKKHKYNFTGWKDHYGNIIQEGDLLACENQTLTATWEKIIEYTCPEGYTLSGNKCKLFAVPTKKCKDKELDIGNETCLGDFKKDSKCGVKTVYFLDGRVEKTEGDFAEDNAMCYYGIEENYSEELCNSTFGEGHYKMDACYNEIGEEVNDCPVDHIYFTEEQLKRKTKLEQVKAGCYKMNPYSSFCEEEYKLENDQCVKTINATVKE